MIKREWKGSYTDPQTGLKMVLVKDADGKVRSFVNTTFYLRGVK
jgi:hypothetical protein